MCRGRIRDGIGRYKLKFVRWHTFDGMAHVLTRQASTVTHFYIPSACSFRMCQLQRGLGIILSTSPVVSYRQVDQMGCRRMCS